MVSRAKMLKCVFVVLIYIAVTFCVDGVPYDGEISAKYF